MSGGGGPRCADVADKLVQLFGWRHTYKVEKRQRSLHRNPVDSWVIVHNLQSHDGGILDPDDRLNDVVDDREQIVASYEDGEGMHHGGGDGASGSSVGTSSPDLFQSDRRYSRNDIEVTGAQVAAAALQVRRGSEPALNQLVLGASSGAGTGNSRPVVVAADPCKRWSATPIIVDEVDGVKDRPAKDTTKPSCENGYLSPGWRDKDAGGERSAFTRFVRDGSSRLSMQFLGDSGGGLHWADAADRLAGQQSKSLPRERRRKEPLGEANSPPSVLPTRLLDSDAEDKPNFDSAEYVIINNDGEPLGIHVVPDYDPLGEEQGILVQGIEPRGKIARDGRLAVYDRIIEINGRNLLNMPFHRVQEIFKDSLHSPELKLRVLRHGALSSSLKKRPPAPVYPRSHGRTNKENEAMVEGEERSVSLSTKLATVSPTKKLSPVHQPVRSVSSLLIANTRKIGRKIELDLVKGPHGLGFSITTRDNPAGGNCPIYIKNILPKGAAVRDGRLKPGDRLLEVNGVEMTGKTQAEAVSVLRNAPPGSKVRIVVSRQEDTSSPKLPRPIANSGEAVPTPDQVDSQNSSQIQVSSPEKVTEDLLVLPWKHREVLTFDIPVHDTEKAGLGVSVKGKTSASHSSSSVDLGIFVKSVLHGGAASRDGRLRTNDQLLNVNGISLLGQSNSDAMETLRQAMLHTEGPVPGVISLAVARRAAPSGRDSASSILSGSSGTETFGEGRFDNSGNSENSDNTVIFLPPGGGSSSVTKTQTNELSTEGRNPVIDRLTGQHASQNTFRNQSYYQATRDVWNTTVPINVSPAASSMLTSPTVNLPSEEMALIEEERLPQSALVHSHRPGRVPGETAHQGRGQPAPSDYSGSSHGADATYASQLSLEENPDGFSRDAFGRQSMSEKRHAALDAKNTDTYQRNKKLREERDRHKSSSQLQPNKTSSASKNTAEVLRTKEHAALGLRANSVESVVSVSRSHADSDRPRNEFGPSLGMKKSSSLESLQTVMQEIQMQEDCEVYRNPQGAVRSVRGRGCNESFRAAVDRSYDAPLAELRSRMEMETLTEEDGCNTGMAVDNAGRSFVSSRGCPRQSSLNAILDSKSKSVKKKPGLLKGIGSMFRFGKHRKPMCEVNVEEGAEEKEAAKRAAQDEQQRIREQYHRLMMQQKELELQEGPQSQTRTERIHQLRAQHQQKHAERRGQYPLDDQEEKYEQVIRQHLEHSHGRSASYELYGEMARPGSRVGITDPNKFSHYVNYEEIQQHLNRRQQHYHSQRQNNSSGREPQQRPISNFFEYESVQNMIRANQQHQMTVDTNSNSLPRSSQQPQDTRNNGGHTMYQQQQQQVVARSTSGPGQQRGVSYSNRGRHRGPFVTHVTIGQNHPLPGSKV